MNASDVVASAMLRIQVECLERGPFRQPARLLGGNAAEAGTLSAM